ncbi:MAG TPA: homoserine dehydrogenase, partial [Nitratifractor sp.]|nr:homoserine dehydrogenase [Nitratifractor sp.]
MIRVGIIGVGTVGTSVANILQENSDIISARAGVEIVPTIGVVKNLAKKRDVSIEITDDPSRVIDNPDIDIVVELM